MQEPRNPARVSPRHQVLKMQADPDTGRRVGVLDCGHPLAARKVWLGKWRWCPVCDPPRPAPESEVP